MKLPTWLYERRRPHSVRFGSRRPLRLCATRLDYGGPKPTWLCCVGRLNVSLGPADGITEGLADDWAAWDRLWERRSGRSVLLAWERRPS